MRRILATALWCALLTVGAATMAAAQTAFPPQPIKLVVPAAPGGSTDVLARVLAQALQQQTGGTFIVDNRAGAGGAIGVATVVNAPSDGATLLVTVPDGVTVLPHLRKDIPYQALTDLAPVAMMAETYWLFAVTPSVPAKTMQELVAQAKAKPGSIRYSSPGIGTSAHLITERLQLESGTEMLHVPYKGAGPATTAVVNGEVDMIATSPISLKTFLDDGRLRALAITGSQRLSALPNVPTLLESGFPGFAASAWFGVFAPAKLPAEQAEKIHAAIAAAVATPDFQKRLVDMGLTPHPMSRAEFASFVAEDSKRWKEVIEKSNVSMSD